MLGTKERFKIERFEYYEIQSDGAFVDLSSFEGREEQVCLIVDNESRLIFLWKGINAGVRQKFIGSRATGDKRKERGYHYKIEVMDQDDETKSFIEIIRGGTPVTPTTSHPDESTLTSTEFSSYAEAAAAQGIELSDDDIRSATAMPGGPAPSHIAKMGGIGARPQKSFLSDPSFLQDVKTNKETRSQVTNVVQEIGKSEALELINALGSPEGFEREMLIVGSVVYRVEVEDDGTFTLEDLENPLDGVIMVQQYTPRLLCENGKVKAVELLKQTSEEIVVDETLTQDLEDLTAMFQIEVE